MDRNTMLKKLQCVSLCAVPMAETYDMGLEYDYISPIGAGTSLGTMPFWAAYKFSGISIQKWHSITKGIHANSITLQDFEETELYFFIKDLGQIFSDFDEIFKKILCSLLNLPKDVTNGFYGLLDFSCIPAEFSFYQTKDELSNTFFDLYCQELIEWNSMDDDELEYWYNRLDTDLSEFFFSEY